MLRDETMDEGVNQIHMRFHMFFFKSKSEGTNPIHIWIEHNLITKTDPKIWGLTKSHADSTDQHVRVSDIMETDQQEIGMSTCRCIYIYITQDFLAVV